MNNELLDIYSDYLLSSFGQTTATGLSKVLDNAISHDRITRFLSDSVLDSRELWKLVKTTVRSIESEDGVVIFDDTIVEKPWTDENEIVCWHFDHCKNRAVKGVNMLNCLYHIGEISIPVGLEIIRKPVWYCDIETRREERKSEVSKNELMRNLLKQCVNNRLVFKYVLTDSWFSSKENMVFIKNDIGKDFIMTIKSNRTVVVCKSDGEKGRFVRTDTLNFEQNPLVVFLKGVPFPVSLSRQVFKNKDGSEGILYLVSSDIRLTYDQVTALYQRRWNIEIFHKSIKSNAGLSKSPTRTVRSQSNHFFASIYAFFKLELLKIRHKMNHFALRSKIYIEATKLCFLELQKLGA